MCMGLFVDYVIVLVLFVMCYGSCVCLSVNSWWCVLILVFGSDISIGVLVLMCVVVFCMCVLSIVLKLF